MCLCSIISNLEIDPLSMREVRGMVDEKFGNRLDRMVKLRDSIKSGYFRVAMDVGLAFQTEKMLSDYSR